MVHLNAGKNVLTYRQSLEQAGVHVYQALVEVEGDVIEENNRAIGITVVRGKPQVLLVDKEEAQAQNLASALRSQYIDVRLVGPEGLPSTMAALEKYDGVILSNVSSLKMTRQQMTLVRDYVRDQGGGLIMIGGEESFGLGGFYRTPIEEALPVTMEVKQKVEIPSLAVMLVIDRSGSMAMGMKDNDKINKLEVAATAGSAGRPARLQIRRAAGPPLRAVLVDTWRRPMSAAHDRVPPPASVRSHRLPLAPRHSAVASIHGPAARASIVKASKIRRRRSPAAGRIRIEAGVRLAGPAQAS